MYYKKWKNIMIRIVIITTMTMTMIVIEGSLEVKLPTIWTVGKADMGRVREEKRRREKIREEEK